MAGAGKKRAKQARADNRSGNISGEFPDNGAQVNDARPTPPGFDGPADSRNSSQGPAEGSRGRQLSNAPPPSGRSGRSGSRAPSAVRPMLRDPAREPKFNRNIDLPGNAYNLFSQYEIPTELVRRPGTNTSGLAVQVSVNSYPVISYPTKTIYQYDVLIGSGVEKRGLIKTVWNCTTLRNTLGGGWIFDGNRIAWALKDLSSEINVQIDLDAEKGQPAREGRSNRHRVVIRKTNIVNLAAVKAYLDGKMSFDNSVLEGINFLDHLMRETPSKHMIAIKRSFFHRKMVERLSIGGGVEAMKGVYQSIRAAQGGRLVVNVDVSNSTFWGNWQMHIVAVQLTGATDFYDLGNHVQPIKKTYISPFTEAPFMRDLKKLKKTRFYVKHRGLAERSKIFTVKDFSLKNTKQWTFNMKDSKTGTIVPDVSIFDYFKKRYNIHLEYPHLPVVETTKKNVAFPMECCVLDDGQRYPFKLNDRQTSAMIKFAVTRPQGRLEAINGGLELLNWKEDIYLKNYGLSIDDKMLQTQARLLAPPTIQFGNKIEKPMYGGRWRLDGKTFLTPNKIQLLSWGVCIINGLGGAEITVEVAREFIRKFVITYKSHGGRFRTDMPPIIIGQTDTGKAVMDIFKKTGDTFDARPQMLVFLMSGKDAFQYLRIKKSCDCRFGVVSQCMQTVHVMRAQPQYMSNVCMKFNAKLGGTTARVALKNPLGHFKVPTMIIGADVSHAAPGSIQPSMAAITASLDKQAIRYVAAAETNGHRVEMITTFNIESMLTPFIQEWMTDVGEGRFPKHVIYFRDGVSEGQYQHVLQQEVRDIKRIFTVLARENAMMKDSGVKFTVIVASKRHHIRFFPNGKPAGDANGNPVPGVLVERDVTHPFEYDFYLNSHSAIQGTARPTHYHVLMDEAKLDPNYLQNMIYEQCYQYIRSTTPVSLFPAVYYAHLASNRARSHEDISASLGPHTGKEQQKQNMKSLTSSERPPTEFKPLLVMDPLNRIGFSMWYV